MPKQLIGLKKSPYWIIRKGSHAMSNPSDLSYLPVCAHEGEGAHTHLQIIIW
jgi:hypothetical protein